MDNLKTIYTALKTSGIKATYRAWPEGKAPKLPFICYLEDGSSNFAADNVVYYPKNDYRVELYTEKKDPTTEALVENALAAFVWQKTETYIDTERCYEIIYTFQL